MIICQSFFGAQAQLSISTGSSLTIKGGTSFAFDSLVLTPAADYTLGGTTVQKSSVPIVAPAGQSIEQVYVISPAMSGYTGTVDMLYDDAGLNGNTASLLQFAVNPNVSGNNGFVTTTGGSVNTAEHTITESFSNETFGQITAVNSGVPLPVMITSFRAILFPPFVRLEWIVNENQQYDYFEVEMSKDALAWSKIGLVAARSSSGGVTYRFDDPDMDFTVKFYRIRLLRKDGVGAYSQVEKVAQEKNNPGNVVVSNEGGHVHISFPGAAPEALAIRDMLGRLVWQAPAGQQEYDISNLVPGAYVAVYIRYGRQEAVKFCGAVARPFGLTGASKPPGYVEIFHFNLQDVSVSRSEDKVDLKSNLSVVRHALRNMSGCGDVPCGAAQYNYFSNGLIIFKPAIFLKSSVLRVINSRL